MTGLADAFCFCGPPTVNGKATRIDLLTFIDRNALRGVAERAGESVTGAAT